MTVQDMDGARNMKLIVDGVETKNLSRFRVDSQWYLISALLKRLIWTQRCRQSGCLRWILRHAQGTTAWFP